MYWGLSKSEYTYLDFIRELITALAQEEIDKRRNGFYLRDKVSGYKSKNDWENDYSKVVGCHTPSVKKKQSKRFIIKKMELCQNETTTEETA